jgi:hypothetical protein
MNEVYFSLFAVRRVDGYSFFVIRKSKRTKNEKRKTNDSSGGELS